MTAWVLLLIMKNPGDLHGHSQRVVLASESACQAAKVRMLESNAAVRATGYQQQLVAVCVEHKL